MGFKQFKEDDYRHLPVESDDTCVQCNLAVCLNIPEAEELVQLNTFKAHARLEGKVAAVVYDHQHETCPECKTFADLDPEEIGGLDKDEHQADILFHRNDDIIDRVNEELRKAHGGDGHRSLEGYDTDPTHAHDWTIRKRFEDLGKPLPPRLDPEVAKAEKMYADVVARMKREGLI